MIVSMLITVFIAATALGLVLVSINTRGIRNFFDSKLQQIVWSASVKTSLQRADLNFTYAEYFYITAISATILMGIGWVISQFLPLAVVAGIAGMIMPRLYVNHRIAARRKQFTLHFSDTLRFISASLKPGISMTETIEIVSRTMPYPINDEFAKLHAGLVYSGSLDKCLDDLYERMPTEEVDDFVTLVKLWAESGGSLSESLAGLADDIDQRLEVEGDIKSKTAQGKMEAAVLVCMPAIFFFVLYAVKPDFIQPALNNSISQMLLLGAVGWQIVGALLTYKIINIRI